MLVNKRPLDAQLPELGARMALLRPLLATGAAGEFNVLVQVRRGGGCKCELWGKREEGEGALLAERVLVVQGAHVAQCAPAGPVHPR